jgi:1-pyrroline-5-carboxylate dehydrogenase
MLVYNVVVTTTIAEIDTAASKPFENEPCLDFSLADNALAMKSALARVHAELGGEYPVIIAGERIFTGRIAHSVNPANPSQTIGLHHEADSSLAAQAIQAGQRAFDGWAAKTLAERASILKAAAGVIRDRKLYFSAWLTYEVGKNWAEADAEVAECIDFLEFYAREALRLGDAKPPI